MFHKPFNTQSERIHVLARLRQDEFPHCKVGRRTTTFTGLRESADNWSSEAKSRFPDDFCSYVPENAQRLILWCLEKNPSHRPSAKELLQSDLIPRKIELEQTYLQDALQIISNPLSDSYGKILNFFFSQGNQQQVELMFDTDACTRADIATKSYKKEHHANLESLGSARTNIDLVKSMTMSPVAVHAATSTLNVSQAVSKTVRTGKEGILLRGVPQCAAIAVAMCAATTAAVTGSYNADPRVVQYVCNNLRR